METIALHQHFYSSVPEGRGLSESRTRGLQTIGCSAAIGDWRLLENHCEFYRPESQQEYGAPAAPLPVNWGWMALDSQWVCIHRIADAGLDDIKREGNFLAHNLLVRRQNLEAVDWDVVSLLRWVADESPVRFPRKTKTGAEISSGFPINGAEVFRAYAGSGTPDQQLARLKAVPPLAVPIARIRELRKQADESIVDKLLKPAIQALGAQGVRDLIAAALAPPEHKRPILIYGLKHSIADSALERRLCELLFAILPFSCRRDFPFATYDHDGSLTEGDANQPHRQRRLIMSTAANDIRLSWYETSHWLINAVDPEPLELQPNSLAKTCIQSCLGGDSSREWLKFRAYADRFNFSGDPIEALGRTRKWLTWVSAASASASASRPPQTEEYELYAFMAGRIREQDASIAELGRVLIGHLQEDRATPSPPGLAEFAKGYANALAARTTADARDIAALVRLWNHALFHQRFDACAALIERLAADDRLQSLREPCRREFSASLPQRWKRWQLGDLQNFWIAVSASWSDSARKAAIQPLVAALAEHALAYLKQSGADKLPSLGLDDERFLLPICAEAPFGKARDLIWRMRLLRDEALAAKFQTRLVTERLDPAMAQQLAYEGPELILRLYPTIRDLAARGPRLPDVLLSASTDPALASRYWTLELAEHDAAIELGMREILRDQPDPRSSWRREWAQRYVSEGVPALIRNINAGLESLLCPPDLFIATQFLLARAAVESLSGDPAAVAAADDHAAALVAKLADLDRVEPRHRPAFTMALKQAIKNRPGLDQRAAFFSKVAAAISQSGPAGRAAIETPRDVLIKECKLDPREAEWHFARISRAFASQGASPLDLERQADADLLTLHPALAVPEAETPALASTPTPPASALNAAPPAPTPAPGFRQWYPRRIDNEVWRLLTVRIVSERDPGELMMWFDTERRAVLSMIAGKGLGTALGERLADRLSKDGVGAGLMDAVLATKPPEEIARELQGRLLGQTRAALNRFNPEDPGADAEIAKFSVLASPLRRVADVLPIEEAQLAWQMFAEVAPRLTPGSQARQWFRNVVEFGSTAAERHGQDLTDLLGREFFEPMAQSRRVQADRFEILANFWESLFLNERGEPKQHRHAALVLAAARGSQIGQWLRLDQQKRYSYYSSLYQCADDQGVKNRLDRIAFARGQAVSMLLWPALKADKEAIRAIAVCCCRLGALSLAQSVGLNDSFQGALAALARSARSDRDWEARLAAKATAGFLLVRDGKKTRCMERATLAKDCGFMNAMRDEVKIPAMRDRVAWLDDMRKKIRDTLMDYGKIPEAEAAAVVKTLAPPSGSLPFWRA